VLKIIGYSILTTLKNTATHSFSRLAMRCPAKLHGGSVVVGVWC
jgi:hypothetical protein